MQEDNAKTGARFRERLGAPHGPSPMKKKAYAPPVLVVRGTLRDMTRHVGHQGHQDGGKKKNYTKTR
jgi:hypothetical protein